MKISFLKKEQSIDTIASQFSELTLLKQISSGELNDQFISSFMSCLLVENYYFLIEMAKMRLNFAKYSEFIIDFLDPHTLTEYGGALQAYNLKALNTTHYAMLIKFMQSFQKASGINVQITGVPAADFAIEGIKLMGSKDVSLALGALYADEVYGFIALPFLYESFSLYTKNRNTHLSLAFLKVHACDAEPAHIGHAMELFDIVKKYELDENAFERGYALFMSFTLKKFDALVQTVKQ